MKYLSLAICFVACLLFIDRVYYYQVLEENSNKYFQLYQNERNYVLETERIETKARLIEARNQEIKLIKGIK